MNGSQWPGVLNLEIVVLDYQAPHSGAVPSNHERLEFLYRTKGVHRQKTASYLNHPGSRTISTLSIHVYGEEILMYVVEQ